MAMNVGKEVAAMRRMTEIMLLGNVALLVGEKLTYDFRTGRFNNPKANALLKREPRKGWELGYA